MKIVQTGLATLLLLTNLACQPSDQVGQAGSFLTQADYSQKLASLYQDYGKANLEGVNTQSLALSFALGASQASLNPTAAAQNSVNIAIPSTLNTAVKGFSAPASNSSATDLEQAKAALKVSQAEILKLAVEANLKAIQAIANKLKTITPPSEQAQNHALLLNYFDLTKTLVTAIQTEVDFSNQANTSDALKQFRDKHKTQMDELEALSPKVMEIFGAYKLAAYRQESLSKQAGPVLDANAYRAKVKTLLPKLSISSLVALSPTETNVSILDSFAALHPPAELLDSHVTIYAALTLSQNIQNRLMDVIGKDFAGSLEQLKKNPLTLFSALFSDTELIVQLMDLMQFLPQTQKALEILNPKTP
jgi:hypothetical protein